MGAENRVQSSRAEELFRSPRYYMYGAKGVAALSFALAEVKTSANPLGTLVQLDQAALPLLPVGVVFCDAEGRILRANRKAEELWGRKVSALEPIQRFSPSLRIETLAGT